MSTKNALEIIRKRLAEKPELKKAYLEEKRNYHVACKIREYRKRAKLTQKQLAQRISTKQSVISRLEHAEYGGHSLTILRKIAKVFDVPVENFLEPENNASSQTLTLHIPPIFDEAASFMNWSENQVIEVGSYANVR